jgi:ATP synthase protein I
MRTYLGGRTAELVPGFRDGSQDPDRPKGDRNGRPTIMSDPRDDSDAAMRARLDRLSGELGARKASERAEEAARPARAADTSGAMAKGLKAASELVGGIVVGGLIGVGLDYWLGTKPAFSIVFFLLGAAGGLWNVIRDAMKPTGGG